MTRQLFAFIQFNGDNRCWCNLHCPECYGHNAGRGERTYRHYWNGRADLWERGLERLNRDIYGVFSYGEALGSKGFYEMVDVFGKHPTWALNIITNLMLDPTRLLNSKLAKDKRLFITATWHPEGIDDQTLGWEVFKRHLLTVKAAGLPVHVMMVWFPLVIQSFSSWFEWLDANGFRVNVRRLVVDRLFNRVPIIRQLPSIAGTYRLADYSPVEKAFLYASVAPKVAKYGLDLANCRGKLCSAGKDMILVKHDGSVTYCAGLVGKRHEFGNLFDSNFKLKPEFMKCPINSCGGDFGMLHLVDDEFGGLPDKLWDDTFISQVEGIPQGEPVAYPKRIEMLKLVEALKSEK